MEGTGTNWLPPGVKPNDELDNDKPEPKKTSIKYPSKEYYSEFYAICEKLNVKVNATLIGLVDFFKDKNKHVLNKGKKK